MRWLIMVVVLNLLPGVVLAGEFMHSPPHLQKVQRAMRVVHGDGYVPREIKLERFECYQYAFLSFVDVLDAQVEAAETGLVQLSFTVDFLRCAQVHVPGEVGIFMPAWETAVNIALQREAKQALRRLRRDYTKQDRKKLMRLLRLRGITLLEIGTHPEELRKLRRSITKKRT